MAFTVEIKGVQGAVSMLKTTLQKELDSLASDLLVEIKQRTPIKTGEARRGWKKNKQQVSNRVPYIEQLERGRSRQAPDGFVRQAVTATVNKSKTRK